MELSINDEKNTFASYHFSRYILSTHATKSSNALDRNNFRLSYVALLLVIQFISVNKLQSSIVYGMKQLQIGDFELTTT